MARRADWDMADDDDFEIIGEFVPAETLRTLEASRTESVSHLKVTSPPLVNNNPVTNEVTYSLEKPSVSTSLPYLPVRYGSAVNIPYEEGFDLKSIVNAKPMIPSNDLMTLIRDDKSSKQSFFDNPLEKLLIDHTRVREHLFDIARKTQQDFISAMNLD